MLYRVIICGAYGWSTVGSKEVFVASVAGQLARDALIY